MKTIDYYMGLPYRMEIIPDTEEGGFTAKFPDLPGCLTCAETIEDLIAGAEDAKKEWLAAALEDGVEIAEPSEKQDLSEFSGQFKLRMPKSLHRSLSLNAKREGISMNQYCVYLLAKNDAAYSSSKAAVSIL
jgi:predicted RNase H-like HicB family nuclease